MGKKIILGFVIISTLILTNIFSRFLYAQSWFSTTIFAKELDPFDVITLIVTTLVTLWLGWYVSKKITEQRYEKEYIITDLIQIEEEINFIEKSLQLSNIDLQTSLDLMSKLKIHVERFSKTVEIFKISFINGNELDKCYRKLYQRTTNLEGNQLSLDDAVRIEINQVCSEFILKTREIIFTINKH